MRMLRLPLLAVGSVVLFAGCGATRQAPVIDRLPPAQSTKPAAPSLAWAASGETASVMATTNNRTSAQTGVCWLVMTGSPTCK